MLYGMADPIKDALVGLGQRVRVYTPYGQLLPGMAYLVRRLLENTANESFLRASFTEHMPSDRLLRNPEEIGREHKPQAQRGVEGLPAPRWGLYDHEEEAKMSVTDSSCANWQHLRLSRGAAHRLPPAGHAAGHAVGPA